MKYLKAYKLFESVDNFDIVKSDIEDIVLEITDNDKFKVKVEVVWRNNPTDVIAINIISYRQNTYKWSDVSDVVMRLIDYFKDIDGRAMISVCGQDFFATDNWDNIINHFSNLDPEYEFTRTGSSGPSGIDNSFNITFSF